jgi:hypothetical protein
MSPADRSQSACKTCHGSGWVCEEHRDRPSAVTTADGCSCGAPATACECNPNGHYDFEAMYASVDPATVKEWVQ